MAAAGGRRTSITLRPIIRSRWTESVILAPQLLLQKFPALTFSAKTSVTLYAAQDGDAGGLIVYGERYAALLVEFGQGSYRLVWRHGWMSDAGVVRETRQVLAELKCGKCQLQVAVGEGGLCQFSPASRGGVAEGSSLFCCREGKMGRREIWPAGCFNGWPTKRGLLRFAGL